eukprot:2164944-Rhodomonas_salina.3
MHSKRVCRKPRPIATHVMSVPDIAQYERRPIASYTTSVPDIGEQARRPIANLSRSLPSSPSTSPGSAMYMSVPETA